MSGLSLPGRRHESMSGPWHSFQGRHWRLRFGSMQLRGTGRAWLLVRKQHPKNRK